MAKMSAYCKAYYVKQLRPYTAWKENVKDLRKGKTQVDGKDVEIERTALTENDIVYLHDNYTVADGVFCDQNIVFDDVTDAWKDFCVNTLSFNIPSYAMEGAASTEAAPQTGI